MLPWQMKRMLYMKALSANVSKVRPEYFTTSKTNDPPATPPTVPVVRRFNL